MTKAVLTHKPGSIYDDLPELRYHFPRTYLRQVEAAIGDFILYYEPGRTGLDERDRTGRKSYVAVARVEAVESDPRQAEHYFALIEPGSYLVLDRPVPFQEGGRYYERVLRHPDDRTNKGAFGRAVRTLADDEFEAILAAGFARELGADEAEWDLPEPTIRPDWQVPGAPPAPGLTEAPALFERPIVERILSRPLRDAAFKRAVREAYDATCAVTGLKLTNGRGRPEVQAAHIRAVEHQGPDSVRNGIALSATVHWLFDRGLISVGPPPRFDIVIGRKGLPEAMTRLINPDGRLKVPASPLLQPAAAFLDFHRSEVFERS